MLSDVTVVIATKNRAQHLEECLRRIFAVTRDMPVIVCDDGSTDETQEVLARHPNVTVVRSDESRGASWQRNRGVAEAKTDIILFLDDDAYIPLQGDVLDCNAALFEDRRIGAVALPFVNVLIDSDVRCLSHEDLLVEAAFVACAAMVKRTAFQAVGGFRSQLRFYGEESDLCLRLLNQGQFTVAGRGVPIEHQKEPGPGSDHAARLGRTNDVLFVVHNAPRRWILGDLGRVTGRSLKFALTSRKFAPAAGGFAEGVTRALKEKRHRQAVSPEAYRLFSRLRYRGSVPLAQVVDQLAVIEVRN